MLPPLPLMYRLLLSVNPSWIEAVPVDCLLYVRTPCVLPPSLRPSALLFLSAAPTPFAAAAGAGFDVSDAVSLKILFAVSAVPDIEILYVVFASLAASITP